MSQVWTISATEQCIGCSLYYNSMNPSRHSPNCKGRAAAGSKPMNHFFVTAPPFEVGVLQSRPAATIAPVSDVAGRPADVREIEAAIESALTSSNAVVDVGAATAKHPSRLGNICGGISITPFFKAPFATNYPFGLHRDVGGSLTAFHVRSDGKATSSRCSGQISSSSGKACDNCTRIEFDAIFQGIVKRAALPHTHQSIQTTPNKCELCVDAHCFFSHKVTFSLCLNRPNLLSVCWQTGSCPTVTMVSCQLAS